MKLKMSITPKLTPVKSNFSYIVITLHAI